MNQTLDGLVQGLPESAKAGLSSELYPDPMQRRDAINTALTEQRKGGDSLEERLISKLPTEAQPKAMVALLNQKLSGSETEFERTINRLVARGVMTESEADNIAVQRLTTMASGDQRRITFDTETGTLSIEEGVVGENAVTANKRDELLAQRDFIRGDISLLEETIANQQKLGAVASIAGALRTGAKVSEDLLTTFPGAGQIINTATSLISTIVSPEESESVKALFNSEQLDQLSLLENSIGLMLARTRSPDGRIPVDVIKRSIADVKLKGLRSDEQVRNRLASVLRQLKTSEESMSKRAGEGGRVINFEDMP